MTSQTTAAPTGSRLYWAFISYSHADEAWAPWLHLSLEKYRVPRRLIGRPHTFGTVPRDLRPVFRDRDELVSGPELSTAIHTALAGSRDLIVICSPRAARSPYVNEEIRQFKKSWPGRSDPLPDRGRRTVTWRPELLPSGAPFRRCLESRKALRHPNLSPPTFGAARTASLRRC